MADEGTVIGSTKSPAGTRPGEKVMMYYHGNVQNGFEMITYLSGVTSYMADTRHRAAGTTQPYQVSVYEVQGQANYRRLYLSVYGQGDGTLDSGGVDVSVWVLGDR